MLSRVLQSLETLARLDLLPKHRLWGHQGATAISSFSTCLQQLQNSWLIELISSAYGFYPTTMRTGGPRPNHHHRGGKSTFDILSRVLQWVCPGFVISVTYCPCLPCSTPVPNFSYHFPYYGPLISILNTPKLFEHQLKQCSSSLRLQLVGCKEGIWNISNLLRWTGGKFQ